MKLESAWHPLFNQQTPLAQYSFLNFGNEGTEKNKILKPLPCQGQEKEAITNITSLPSLQQVTCTIMTDPFPPMYVEVPLPVDQTKPHELQQVNVSGITARSASIQTFRILFGRL